MAQKTKITELRDFPSVEELLQHKSLTPWYDRVPRPLAADVVREVLADEKAAFQSSGKPLMVTALVSRVGRRLEQMARSRIKRVINATGIIVHTNLGRAPISDAMFDAVRDTVMGYGNIEFDLSDGKRGKRGELCETMLARLAGAEAATIVNNCAAGLFITLNTLANRKAVVISRGELVQIGGGFRIPDILRKSGSRLSEVGSTNITTVADYEQAIDDRVGLILKVHRSNFVQEGFTEEASLADLVKLGRSHQLPVVNDLGSGVLVPTRDMLGYDEPTVQQSVKAGADITSFSGDKLLGGVQAGLLVGKQEHIRKIKKNPLFRTIRVDKFVFSMLEQLLSFYLSERWQTEIKLWELLRRPEAELYKQAKKMLAGAGKPPGMAVEATSVYVGGGALPQATIPSVALTFAEPFKPNRLLKLFRELDPPVIGRIEEARFLLDLKAVLPEDLTTLEQAVTSVLKAESTA